MRKVFVLIFSLLFFNAFSQNVELSGTVKDSKTGEPVAFANVVVQSALIGTVTNEAGQFRLVIPDKFVGDSVTISSIGYSSAMLKVPSNQSKAIEVTLDPKLYEIGEVVVLPKELTPTIILGKALRKFRRRIAETSYMQDFFYRELTVTRDTFSFLMETAAEVCFPRFTSEDNKIRIRVNQIRRSSFFGDAENSWLRKLIARKFYGKIDNGIYFFWDKYGSIIDGLQNFDLSEMDTSKIKISLKGLTYIDSIKVYEINMNSISHTATFYIRSDNNQIIKYERGFSVPKEVYSVTSGFIDGQYMEKFELNFVQMGRRFVFSHGWYKSMPHSPSISPLKDNSMQMQELQVVANRTKFSGYRNIKKNESLGKDANLYVLEYKYDPEFWGNYNTFILNPLLKQQQNDLEHGVTLEQQFIQNQKATEL